MKDMKIIFSDTPYDYAQWFQEKCGNILRALCVMLRDNPNIENDDSFQDALSNALKIYALCNENLNGIYCELVLSLLLKYNISGYYLLQDLIHGTHKSTIIQDTFLFDYDENILTLIEQNEKTNRTKIAELIAKTKYPSCWIKEISADIEFVHNGDQSWEWFYTKHCHDRDNLRGIFVDSFIAEVCEYFKSSNYKFADSSI